MKTTVILTLAATLFCLCGCSKDDNGSYVFHDSYFYFQGNKIPITKIPDRYYVIIKTADSARILSEFERNGIVMDKDSYSAYGFRSDAFNVPDELKDCHDMIVTSSKDPAELVEGIINSNHLYLVEHYTYEYNVSNGLIVGIENEKQLEVLQKYAAELQIYLVLYEGIFAELLCTNRSAGDNIQVANWLYETGEFEFAHPAFGDFIPAP